MFIVTITLQTYILKMNPVQIGLKTSAFGWENTQFLFKWKTFPEHWTFLNIGLWSERLWLRLSFTQNYTGQSRQPDPKQTISKLDDRVLRLAIQVKKKKNWFEPKVKEFNLIRTKFRYHIGYHPFFNLYVNIGYYLVV